MILVCVCVCVFLSFVVVVLRSMTIIAASVARAMSDTMATLSLSLYSAYVTPHNMELLLLCFLRSM